MSNAADVNIAPPKQNTSSLREELDWRRRNLLRRIDELFADRLYRRLGEQRRHELADEVERLIEAADRQLLRKEQSR